MSTQAKPTRRLVKYFLYLLAALLLLIIVAAISAYKLAPRIIIQQANQWYQSQVPNGSLQMAALDLDLFKGSARIEKLIAKQDKHTVLKTGELQLQWNFLDLIDKKINIHNITLADFYIDIHQNKNKIKIAGLEMALSNAKSNSKASPQFNKIDLQKFGLNSLQVDQIDLKNIAANYHDDHNQVAFSLPKLRLHNIGSDNHGAIQLNANLNLEKLAIKLPDSAKLALNQTLKLNLNASLENLFVGKQQDSSANINAHFADIGTSLTYADSTLDVWLDQLKINIAEVNLNQPESAKVALQMMDAKTKLTHADMQADFGFSRLKLDANIHDLLKNIAAKVAVNIVDAKTAFNRDALKTDFALGSLHLTAELSDLSKNATGLLALNLGAFNYQINSQQLNAKGALQSLAMDELQLAKADAGSQNGILKLPVAKLQFKTLNLQNGQAEFSVENAKAQVNLANLEIHSDANNVDLLQQPIRLNIGSNMELGGEYQWAASKTLKLQPSAKLSSELKIAIHQNAKEKFDIHLNANGKMQDVHLQALPLANDFIQLARLQVDDLQTDLENFDIANFTLTDLVAKTQKHPLLKLQDLKIANINLNFAKAAMINIDKIMIGKTALDLEFGKDYQLPVIKDIKNYFATANQPMPANKTNQNNGLKLNIQQINNAAPIDLTIVDKAIQPQKQHAISLNHFALNHFKLNDASATSKLAIKAALGKYSKADFNVSYQLFADKPSGFVKGQLQNIDLTEYNAYLQNIMGYIATTGVLNLGVDVEIDKGELGGGLDVGLLAIKLQSANPDKIAALKQNLSMPLDQALDLLRDKNDDINLLLPLKGNVKSPDFSLRDVMRVVMQKALKTATVIGLKNMLQPYGALITIGEWAGDQLLAVRLAPVQYEYGEVELNSEQQKYLDKVASVLKAKQSLRIKLCPRTSSVEADFFALDSKQLHGTSQQRASNVKDYLINIGKINPARVLFCHGSDTDKSKSLIDLEV